MRGSFPAPIVFENAKTFAGMIASHLRELGAAQEPLGLDITELPFLRALEAEGIEVVDGQQTILNAAAVKTPEEVALIETSISIVEAAFWEVVTHARPGLRENEINGMMREVMYGLGAEEIQNINVISGNRSHPHPHDASDRLLRMGDMLFIDVVSVFNGYKTCYYQTFVIGKPSQRQLDVYRQTYDWLFNAIELIRPGVSTAEIARVWPTAQELGLSSEAEAFALEIGHGIGITHWAKPVISRMFSFEHPEELQENMVLAMETYAGSGNDGAHRGDAGRHQRWLPHVKQIPVATPDRLPLCRLAFAINSACGDGRSRQTLTSRNKSFIFVKLVNHHGACRRQRQAQFT
jgi:Xaa-Pro dipeptidase